MDFKSFFDVTKLPTKILFVIAIITGFYLFASPALISRLHLEKFEQYNQYVGLAFLFSGVLVVVNFIIWLFNKANYWLKTRSIKANYKEIIRNLDPQEQSVLREFFICAQSSISMPIDDAVVSGLLQKGILRMNKQIDGSSIGYGLKFALSINSYAKKILQLENIGLMNHPTETQKNEILSARPTWVRSTWRW